MKLLVIDLKNPENTHYHDPNKIASFMVAKTVPNYSLFAISDDLKKKKQILTTTCEVTELQLQVLGQLHALKKEWGETQ